MLYRSRASVTGSIPHSYDSSLTLLYFFGWTRLAITSVSTAKPVATTTKMAMGMYADGMGNWDARCAEKRLVYNTRSEGCQESGPSTVESRKLQIPNHFDRLIA